MTARPLDQPSALSALNLDPRGLEASSIRARLLTRMRGEQTLKRMRKRGLRAHPPIRLAPRSTIDDNFAWAVEIGAYTIIATDVRILAHDAAVKRVTGYTEVRPVSIGERCYIGVGAIILPGSVIGDDAIIGAGAVVRGAIPAASVAVGAPARVVTSIAELRDRHLTLMDASPRFERWPQTRTAAEFTDMQRALAEQGRIYVP
jgi:maltose O-acetyltransferase